MDKVVVVSVVCFITTLAVVLLVVNYNQSMKEFNRLQKRFNELAAERAELRKQADVHVEGTTAMNDINFKAMIPTAADILGKALEKMTTEKKDLFLEILQDVTQGLVLTDRQLVLTGVVNHRVTTPRGHEDVAGAVRMALLVHGGYKTVNVSNTYSVLASKPVTTYTFEVVLA